MVKSVTPEGVESRIRIVYHPFKLELLVGDATIPNIVLNEGNRLYFEQRKDKLAGEKVSERALEDSAQSGEDEREIIDWGEDGKPIYKEDAGQNDASAAKENEDTPNENAQHDVNDPDAPEVFGGHTDSRPHGN